MAAQMTGRERVRRAITFTGPHRAPLSLGVPQATIDKYGGQLRDLISQFESDFGGNGWKEGPDSPRPIRHSDTEWTDEWGVRWSESQPGLMAMPVTYPLADWRALASYRLPRMLHGDFSGVPEALSCGRQGKWVSAYGGRLFERMQWLRGADDLLADLASPPREAYQLRDMIVESYLEAIEHWVQYDIDAVGFEDDWGGQQSLIISPQRWREFFRPAYARLFAPVLAAGKHVFFHTDGIVWDILPDLLDLGVSCINLQYALLGLERLGRDFGGRLAFHLDLEGQRFMPNATPDQVKEHVRALVATLGSHNGGLILDAWVMPDVPWPNIAAMFSAFAELR
ncbi:MAG: uroporphyrinogen decarboxylase family protein [Armatimonadota bacterium]